MPPKTSVVFINAEKAIEMDNDFSGVGSGHCVACGARGWIQNLGLPNWSQKGSNSSIRHKENCPMNFVLNEKGELIDPEYQDFYRHEVDFLEDHGLDEYKARTAALENIDHIKKLIESLEKEKTQTKDAT